MTPLEQLLHDLAIALEDWIVTYASELSSPERVNQAVERFSDGGTLYYIAHLRKRVLDEIAALRSSEPGWIPVGERLPKFQENVLMWLVTKNPVNSGVVLGQRSSYENQKFWDGHIYRPFSWISHWMPLPARPTPALNPEAAGKKS